MKLREQGRHHFLFIIYTSLPSTVNTSPLCSSSFSPKHNLFLCSPNMASISQGLVFTSAMLFSTTLLYLAFSKHKTFQIPSDSNKQILRSCMYSGKSNLIPFFFLFSNTTLISTRLWDSVICGAYFVFCFVVAEEKKRGRKKKKKKVKFAKNVMVKEVEREVEEENREEQGMQNRVSRSECERENLGNAEIPANRIALYNGILRDRVQRMACCH